MRKYFKNYYIWIIAIAIPIAIGFVWSRVECLNGFFKAGDVLLYAGVVLGLLGSARQYSQQKEKDVTARERELYPLIGIDEVSKYFPTRSDRIMTYQGKESSWWLRSPGSAPDSATIVEKDGNCPQSRDVDSNYADVRPAFYLAI